MITLSQKKLSKLAIITKASTLISLFLVASCGKDDKPSTKTTNVNETTNLADAPKDLQIGASIAKPTNLIDLSKESIESQLQSNGELFPSLTSINGGSGTDQPEEPGEACWRKKSDDLKASFKNQWLIFQGEVDLTACEQKTADSPAAKSRKMRIFSAVFLAQYDGEGSEFQNKKISELKSLFADKKLPDKKGPVTTGLVTQIQMDVEYEPTTSPSGEVNTTKYRSTAMTMGSNGGACIGQELDDETETLTDCVKVNFLVYDSPKNLSANQYEKLTFKDVSGPKKGPFFTAGNVAVEIGDWSGTVTYSGKNTPPTWRMAKGSETITGQLKQKK